MATSHEKQFMSRLLEWMDGKGEELTWKILTEEKKESIIKRLEELSAGNVHKSAKDRRWESRFTVMRELPISSYNFYCSSSVH